MDKAWEMLPLVVFFGVGAYVVKIILENATRRKLIDKGMVDENVKYLYMDKPTSQTLSALKWGIVAIGIGVAIFIGQMVQYDLREEVTIGCMFIFGGLALVIYYPIANRVVQKHKQDNSHARPQ
jgi:Na+-transporting methylmalonyl-CoA/oxaloacetate decarboxylase beta subunit